MINWPRGKWWLLIIVGVFAWLLIWHFKANFVLALFVTLAIGLVLGIRALAKPKVAHYQL
jgi:hypothetical protein